MAETPKLTAEGRSVAPLRRVSLDPPCALIKQEQVVRGGNGDPAAPSPSSGDGGPRPTLRNLPSAFALLALLATLLLSGCAAFEDEVDETYGRVSGNGQRSVAGLGALAEMYREAGFEVRIGDSLGRHLDRAQTIVWAPDSYELPSDEVCDFFERWLLQRPGRTLVYIGRDYSAEYDYWSDMTERLQGAQKIKALRKKAQKSYDARLLRNSYKFDQTHRWFVQEDAPVPRRVERLSAPAWSGWTAGIDDSKTRLTLQSSLSFPPPTDEEKAAFEAARFQYEQFGSELDEFQEEFDGGVFSEAGEEYDEALAAVDPVVLLEADGRPMVSSAQFGVGENPSALVVVSNGSFLLNYPLTIPENRKLAAKLIDESGPPGLAYFLYSGPAEIEIRDPRDPRRTAWTMFTEWPLGIFMIHLTIAGLIVCLAAFPIFGRARSYVTRDLQDFGYHLEAVGKLLERRKAYDFARQRLAAYSEWIRRQGGSRIRAVGPSAALESPISGPSTPAPPDPEPSG